MPDIGSFPTNGHHPQSQSPLYRLQFLANMGRGPQKVDLTVAMGYHPPKAYICHEQNRFEAISQLRKDLTDLQLPMPKADSVRFLAGAAMGTVEFTWHEQLRTGVRLFILWAWHYQTSALRIDTVSSPIIEDQQEPKYTH